jgi:hypothetical protein
MRNQREFLFLIHLYAGNVNRKSSLQMPHRINIFSLFDKCAGYGLNKMREPFLISGRVSFMFGKQEENKGGNNNGP